MALCSLVVLIHGIQKIFFGFRDPMPCHAIAMGPHPANISAFSPIFRHLFGVMSQYPEHTGAYKLVQGPSRGEVISQTTRIRLKFIFKMSQITLLQHFKMLKLYHNVPK